MAGAFHAACGRVTGRAHATSGLVCQDFVAAGSGDDGSGVGYIVLADGAGSRRHAASGAEAAVGACEALLKRGFDALHARIKANATGAARSVLDVVLKALDAEALRLGCERDALAATLVFAAQCGERYVTGHIGDGVIFQRDGDGVVHTASPPFNGEYANTTAFVTDAEALSRLRVSAGECAAGGAGGFAVVSDGCAHSLYHRRSGRPAEAVGKLMAWNARLGREEMEAVLQFHLEETFASKTGDDCSLALLTPLA